MRLGTQKLKQGINTTLTVAYVMLSTQLSSSEAIFDNLNTIPDLKDTKYITLQESNKEIAYDTLLDPNPEHIPVSLLDLETINQTVLQTINDARKKKSLSPLTIDADLQKHMQGIVQNMETNTHNSNLRRELHSKLIFPKHLGDIIAGTGTNSTVSHVFQGWMKGQHKELILSPEYSSVGIGYHEGQWLVIFMQR